CPQRNGGYGIPRIMRVAEHHTHLGIEIVVHANQFLAPIGRLRGCGYKEIRSRRGERNHTQEGHRTGIHGDRSQASIKCSTRPRISGTVCSGANISEIPASFRHRRDDLVEILSGDAIPPPLLGPEEESLVLFLVVEAWNINRTTDGIA